MNVNKEIKDLVPSERIEIKNVLFEVKRFVENNSIKKEILVSDSGKQLLFKENVRMYDLNGIKNFFSSNNLEVVYLFGNYDLAPFNEETSERLILIGRKK